MICSVHNEQIAYFVIGPDIKQATSTTFKCSQCLVSDIVKPTDQVMSTQAIMKQPNNESKFQQDRILNHLDKFSSLNLELVNKFNFYINDILREITKRLITIQSLNIKLVEEWIMENKKRIEEFYFNRESHSKTMFEMSKLISECNDKEKITDYFNQYIAQVRKIDSIIQIKYKRENIAYFESYLNYIRRELIEKFDNVFKHQASNYFSKYSQLNILKEIDDIKILFIQQEANYHDHIATIIREIEFSEKMRRQQQFENNNQINNGMNQPLMGNNHNISQSQHNQFPNQRFNSDPAKMVNMSPQNNTPNVHRNTHQNHNLNHQNNIETNCYHFQNQNSNLFNLNQNNSIKMNPNMNHNSNQNMNRNQNPNINHQYISSNHNNPSLPNPNNVNGNFMNIPNHHNNINRQSSRTSTNQLNYSPNNVRSPNPNHNNQHAHQMNQNKEFIQEKGCNQDKRSQVFQIQQPQNYISQQSPMRQRQQNDQILLNQPSNIHTVQNGINNHQHQQKVQESQQSLHEIFQIKPLNQYFQGKLQSYQQSQSQFQKPQPLPQQQYQTQNENDASNISSMNDIVISSSLLNSNEFDKALSNIQQQLLLPEESEQVIRKQQPQFDVIQLQTNIQNTNLQRNFPQNRESEIIVCESEQPFSSCDKEQKQSQPILIIDECSQQQSIQIPQNDSSEILDDVMNEEVLQIVQSNQIEQQQQMQQEEQQQNEELQISISPQQQNSLEQQEQQEVYIQQEIEVEDFSIQQTSQSLQQQPLETVSSSQQEQNQNGQLDNQEQDCSFEESHQQLESKSATALEHSENQIQSQILTGESIGVSAEQSQMRSQEINQVDDEMFFEPINVKQNHKLICIKQQAQQDNSTQNAQIVEQKQKSVASINISAKQFEKNSEIIDLETFCFEKPIITKQEILNSQRNFNFGFLDQNQNKRVNENPKNIKPKYVFEIEDEIINQEDNKSSKQKQIDDIFEKVVKGEDNYNCENNEINHDKIHIIKKLITKKAVNNAHQVQTKQQLNPNNQLRKKINIIRVERIENSNQSALSSQNNPQSPNHQQQCLDSSLSNMFWEGDSVSSDRSEFKSAFSRKYVPHENRALNVQQKQRYNYK